MFCINGTDLIVLLLLIQKKYFVCLVLLFSCCCLLLLLFGWLVGWLVAAAAAAAVFLQIFYPQSTAMLVHFLPMKSRKKLVRDVFNAFDTHVDLVYDVTDTDCSTQNGCTYGCLFRSFQTSNFVQTGPKTE